MRKQSELVDIDACKHAETTAALFISDDGDRSKAVWVPKQHCEIHPGRNGNFVVTMPEWLARDKGLI